MLPIMFTITTKRQRITGGGYKVESHREVATLEEARKAIMDMHFHAPSYWPDLRPFHDSLSESGGTITIPDGTVIEVERVTHLHLDDAYNAREES